MSHTYGKYGPAHPVMGALGYRIGYPLFKKLCAKKQLYTVESAYAKNCIAAFQRKFQGGETVYLLGLGSSSHNAGVALVEVSQKDGIKLHCNNEEERYTGVKHYSKYPALSIDALMRQMSKMGIAVSDIHACLVTFDFAMLCAIGLQSFLEEFPGTLTLLKPQETDLPNVAEIFTTPLQLGKQLGLGRPFPVIGMRHHDNHAYFSYAVSPFAQSEEPVMVISVDGFGDDGCISTYIGKKGQLKLLRSNGSMVDSLGLLYSYLSATQGGWPPLSSEGRYMGAAAWGNSDRLTNTYYRQLRQLLYFGAEGQILLNRSMVNWHKKSFFEPYAPALIEILGSPIALKDMWNPDAVLDVENIRHRENTQERVDKAAAVQLLFEDALFHIVEHLINSTKSSRLVLAGGCALNCIANMRLMEHFNEAYYERYLQQQKTSLHIWVPPTPSDTGVTMGAAYSFALMHGASAGNRLSHAFFCGLASTIEEIQDAIRADEEISFLSLGNICAPACKAAVADLMAFIVSKDGIIGLYQGRAETGPRALGHRSILANPCNPQTRENLNTHVKFRELIRPLAPMLTYEAAQRWFDLLDGASDADYNAYNYMVLTARARPESYAVIPAVIHKDGTGRLQIVREDIDPLTHAYLLAMGRRVGVEVSVNTSLNVGSPIVQTPVQALSALKRTKKMDGLFMIGDDGEVLLVWHNASAPPKDAGKRLQHWVQLWQEEVSFSLP